MFKRSIRVLLVEDNRELRKTLAVILRTAHLKVDTAPDASDAFRLIARHQYDVALVDMVLLPGSSGIEVIRNLRSAAPATRVFACTAYCKGELLAEASALGVEQIMYKPVDPALLIRLIQKPAGPVRPQHEPGLGRQVRPNDQPISLHHSARRAGWLWQGHGALRGARAMDSVERAADEILSSTGEDDVKPSRLDGNAKVHVALSLPGTGHEPPGECVCAESRGQEISPDRGQSAPDRTFDLPAAGTET